MLSFTRSAMSLPANEQQRLLATFHPHVDAKHFHVLHRVARTSPAVLKSCQTSVLTPPTSSCLLCPNSPHLSVHHKCNVVVYGFGGARQATKISTRCQRCRNIYIQLHLRSETLGMVGLCIRKPGIWLRLATPASSKDLCSSCSVR